MARGGNPKDGPDELVFEMIPIPPKYPADYLLDNTERRVVSDESMARDYLETFYRALVDNGLRWPMLDFNDLMTPFCAIGELILLPTIESADVDSLKQSFRRLIIEEHVAGYDIVLLTLSASTQCGLDVDLYGMGFRNHVADVTGEDIKLFLAQVSTEKNTLSDSLYLGTMIIHRY